MNTLSAIVSKKKQNVTILSMYNIAFDADNIYRRSNRQIIIPIGGAL